MVKKEKKLIKKKDNGPVKQITKSKVKTVKEDPTSASNEAELKYLRYSLSPLHCCERHLFLKRCLSSPNAIIISNIPAFLDIDVVKRFIQQFTDTQIHKVLNVRSSSLNGALDQGQITLTFELDSEKAVESALERCQTAGPYVALDHGFIIPDFMAKATAIKYTKKFVNHKELKKSVDQFMDLYDANLAESKREAKKRAREPDDEGWITVTRESTKVNKEIKLKNAPLVGTLKNKKKELDISFYAFQAKESKLKKAQELQAKFEEDKKKVEMLKRARNFKPL